MRKKRYALLSILIVLVMLFTSACGSSMTDSDQKAFSQTPKEPAQKKESGEDKKDTGIEALSEVNEIPEDGIIRKEQFETVAGQDMQVSFVGQTDDGYRYTWTYDASKIQNPQDQNLLIDFNKDDLDDIKVSANNANDALEMTMHGQGLICPPTLTVEIPEAWQSDSCLLLKEQNGELARMSDVTIQSSPKEDPGESGKEKNSDSKKKDKDSDDKGQSGDDSKQPDLESLTAPVPGTTTLIMTVTSIDGICYIVGGITNEGKISQINDIAKASENANAAAGSDEDAGSGGSGGSGSGTDKGNGAGSTQRGINGSSNKESGGNGSGSNSKSGKKGSGSGNSSSGDSGKKKTLTCTISINCSTILNNMENLTDGKEEFVPGNGWILKKTKVKFKQGDSVHDILQKVCRDKGIHMESRYTPAYDSAYVEGINQLYEFDCGELSGWMFNVNGWFPNYGCSKYIVSDGDAINWVYTCDLGKDVGDNSMY